MDDAERQRLRDDYAQKKAYTDSQKGGGGGGFGGARYGAPTAAGTTGEGYTSGGLEDPNDPNSVWDTHLTKEQVAATFGHKTVDRYRGLANDWAGQTQGPQMDLDRYNADRANAAQSRFGEQDAQAMLDARARGNAPSAAEGEMGAGLDANLKHAAGASFRGGGNALAQNAAGIGAASGAGHVNIGAAGGRAQETSSATNALTGAQTKMRAADLQSQGLSSQMAFRQAALEAQQRELALRGQLEYEGMGQGAVEANRNSLLKRDQIASGHAVTQAGLNEKSAANRDATAFSAIGAGTGALSGAIGAFGHMGGGEAAAAAPAYSSSAADAYGQGMASLPENGGGYYGSQGGYYDPSDPMQAYDHDTQMSDVNAKQNIQPMGGPGQYLTSPAGAKQNIWDLSNPNRVTGLDQSAEAAGSDVGRYRDAANMYGKGGLVDPRADLSTANADAAQAGQARFGQGQTLGLLHDRAMGLGTSPAQAQLQQGLQAGLSQQQALAHSARGGVQNVAAAAQNAQTQSADLRGTTEQQAGILHSKERAEAEMQYSNAIAQQRAQDLQAAGMSANDAFQQAQLEAGQRKFSQEAQLGFERLGQKEQGDVLGNEYGRIQLGEDQWSGMAGINQAGRQRQGSNIVKGIGAATGGVSALGSLSDERAKQNIQPLFLSSGAAMKQNVQPIATGQSSFGVPQGPTGMAMKAPEATAAPMQMYNPNAATPPQAQAINHAQDPIQQSVAQDVAPTSFAPSAAAPPAQAAPGQQVFGASPFSAPSNSPYDLGAQASPSYGTYAPQPPSGMTLFGGSSLTSDAATKKDQQLAEAGNDISRSLDAQYGPPSAPMARPAPLPHEQKLQHEANDIRRGLESQFGPTPHAIKPAHEMRLEREAADIRRGLDSQFGAPAVHAPSQRESYLQGQGNAMSQGLGAQFAPSPVAMQHEQRAPYQMGPSSVSEQALDQLHPYAYTYKPGVGEDPHKQRFGIMAQDLEKSPMGKSVVVDTPAGKKIDVPQATGVQFAMLADMHDRLRKGGL